MIPCSYPCPECHLSFISGLVESHLVLLDDFYPWTKDYVFRSWCLSAICLMSHFISGLREQCLPMERVRDAEMELYRLHAQASLLLRTEHCWQQAVRVVTTDDTHSVDKVNVIHCHCRNLRKSVCKYQVSRLHVRSIEFCFFGLAQSLEFWKNLISIHLNVLRRNFGNYLKVDCSAPGSSFFYSALGSSSSVHLHDRLLST